MSSNDVTMREACAILEVSRAMVQKLEAAGELKGRRENGRVVFDRGEVEAVKTARDIAKVQREQETEERETARVRVEADRQELEFIAGSKTFADRIDADIERGRSNDTLDALRAEVRELKDAEHWRYREAQLATLAARAEHRLGSAGSGPLDGLLEFAPAVVVLALAYLARDKRTAQDSTVEESASRPAVVGARFEDGSAPRSGTREERLRSERLAASTGGPEDIAALAAAIWSELHRDGD